MPRWIQSFPRRACIVLLRVYQYALSPLSPGTCRYVPSCSQYAIEAIEQYGAFRGCLLAGWRLLRCNPWGRWGYDPPRWFFEPRPGDDAGAA